LSLDTTKLRHKYVTIRRWSKTISHSNLVVSDRLKSKSQAYYNPITVARYKPIARPTTAFGFSIIGGLLDLFIGLISLGTQISQRNPGPGIYNLPAVAGFGVIGTVWGLLIVTGSVLMFYRPKHHQLLGAFVFFVSIISFSSVFFVGPAMGAIGGVLGYNWDQERARELAEIRSR